MRQLPTYFVIVILFVAGPAWGQDTPKPAQDDDLINRPTEAAVHITPAMARAISRELSKGLFVSRYQLEESQADRAAEALARRIMQAAHEGDRDIQDLLEFYAAKMLELASDPNQRRKGITREFGMGFAQKIAPLLPVIRDCMRNIGQDITPMLPMKQQLKWGADMLAANTALDAFEENMKLWSQGDVDTRNNPFKPKDQQIEKNELGHSRKLQNATKEVGNSIENNNKKFVSEWEKYVRQAKEFYDFDEAQAATADSVLREMIQRAETINNDQNRREEITQARIWLVMLKHLPSARDSSLTAEVLSKLKILNQPITALEKELKQRIDIIPTDNQRIAADKRLETALKDMGLDLEDILD